MTCESLRCFAFSSQSPPTSTIRRSRARCVGGERHHGWGVRPPAPDKLKRVLADPADLGVVESAALLRSRELSSSELVTACLRRIDERDGTHSADGDPSSVNAWVRVYPDDALRGAAQADARLTAKAPASMR